MWLMAEEGAGLCSLFVFNYPPGLIFEQELWLFEFGFISSSIKSSNSSGVASDLCPEAVRTSGRHPATCRVLKPERAYKLL